MIATKKRFKKEGNLYIETLDNGLIGYTYVKNNINYRIICDNIIPDISSEYIQFSLSNWFLNNESNSWIFINNQNIVYNKNVWRDINGNLFVDSGDNLDSDNAYDYSSEEIIDNNDLDDHVEYRRVKTLKSGLKTEFDLFYESVILGIFQSNVDLSILSKSINDITEIK